MDSESRDRIRAVIARLADIPDEAFNTLDVPDESPELEALAALPRRITFADDADLYFAELSLPVGWNRCGCGRWIPCRHCDPMDDGPDCGA